MATRKFKATSQGVRHRSVSGFEEITTDKPLKSLKYRLKKKSGRNNTGRITVRRKGGGAKKIYRKIDFLRDKDNVPGVIKTVEYDPNRTSYISLVYYKDGDKRYIISSQKTLLGEEIISGQSVDIKPGNCMILKNIPTGSIIHNVEISVGKGAQLARSAGTNCVLMAKSEKYATVKLPSGEIRLINIKCKATIGQVGNMDKRNTVLGKAGASRWKGRRPKVRGAVMNPCDHPHGGGEGKAPVGRSGPMTPWGKSIFKKTVRRKRKYILKKRK
jgi:large subunit ribosomal protein L2